MAGLSEMTERLASAALLASPNDLPALARLHEELLQVPKQVTGEVGFSEAASERLSGAAGVASKLVEQIMLREVADANAALDAVCENIAQLQQMLAGGVAGANEIAATTAKPVAAVVEKVAGHGDGVGEEEALPKGEDIALVTDFIAEARGHLETAEADLLKLEDQPEDQDLVNSVFRAFHTIKGVAGFLNLKQIGSLTHATESLLDQARKGELVINGGVLDTILAALDMSKRFIGAVETAVKQGTAIPAEKELPGMLERLHQAASGGPVKAAEAAATPAAVAEQEKSGATEERRVEERRVEDRRVEDRRGGTEQDATVKVATQRLDALINMVGELVIAQSMVSQDMVQVRNTNQRISRNLAQLGKITRELQDLTMTMRMVPIQGVFQKMARLVRDLSRRAGKEIELHIVGGETELDRNLVEAVADPLVHMVRNAADHGIEMPEDRVKAGKPRAGRLELKAYHQAGNIVIEISDDGKGLNQKRILEKAMAAGLVREGQELSEQEIFKLIFHPGLSTAEKITDISGRGVGMDVVRRNVETLRGRIDITSVQGKGSTFAIRLPLTLAVIDGLVVKVGAERYILPITSIEQSMQPKAEQLSTVQNKGEMCMIRGDLIPLYRLYQLFNVKPVNTDPCQGLLVIVQDGTRRCGIMVDELLGQQQVVIKSLGDAMGQVKGVSGGAILGDGTISLILDVPGLMDLVVKG